MSGFATPKPELISIITPDIKQTAAYQTLMASLARADAHHDLGSQFSDTIYKNEATIQQAFNSGLPAVPSIHYNESAAFAAAIISAPVNGADTRIDGSDATLQAALNAVPDCTLGEVAPSIFEVGTGGNTFFQYKVVKFVIECSTNKPADKANAAQSNENFGKKFVEYTRLGEDFSEAAIIVDFSQHHFMDKLASGERSDFTIKYLMTPEVVNDPAGKPNVNNATLFGIPDKGVRLNSYVQTDIDVTSYTKFDEADPSPANNFFSKYDFTLSPIKQIFTKQKAEKLITTLNIKYDDGYKPLTDTIEDSKGENSITTVLGYLKQIMKKIISNKSGKVDNAVNFNFNSKCQQKRGGDWFQGLSCLDARDRTFTQILPERGQPTKLDARCPIYLVTHDRIAAAYALLNGINVIYIDYYGRIFVFKNAADQTLKGSGKPIEQLLFDGLREKWTPKLYDELMTTGYTYTTSRAEYLERKESEFNDMVDRLTGEIGSIDFDLGDKTKMTKAIASYQSIVSDCLQELFRTAVELMFIQINLVDIAKDFDFVNKIESDPPNSVLGKGVLYPDDQTGPAYDAFTSKITNFNKSINNIKSVQDRFGKIAESKSLVPSFTNWVNGNVKKLDVYRAANSVFPSTRATDAAGLMSRITSFFSKRAAANPAEREERYADSHIFLPFIQCLHSDYKNKIIVLLGELTVKTGVYYDAVIKSEPRTSRTGKPSPVMDYYNKVANLIYESVIFLNTNPPAEPAAKNDIYAETQSLIVDSISTDNILLKTDIGELRVFNGDGKYSNLTNNVYEIDETGAVKESEEKGAAEEDEEETTEEKGALKEGAVTANPKKSPNKNPIGYIAAYDDPNGAKSGVVCDVSIKQVTWPLLTVLLTTVSDSFDRFINAVRGYVPDVVPTEDASVLPGEVDAEDQYVRSLFPSRGGQTGNLDKNITDLTAKLYDQYRNDSPCASNDNLMLDFKLGFHPLVPIYAMLTAYYNTLGNKSQGDPFFYTYFTYINVLEKMKEIIVTNYLADVNNPCKTASAYLLGFGLNTMLIKSNTSLLQTNEILKVIGMNQSDYYTFSLKNDSFAGLITGAIHQTPAEETQGVAFVNNPLFGNFINNEVNIKQILETGTPADNLPDYEVLKDRIFNLMSEIVLKVNADRGTPIGPPASVDSDTAAGIPGISREERKESVLRGQERYLQTLAQNPQVQDPILKPFDPERVVDASKLFTYTKDGSPENVVESTTSSSTGSRGGKKSYRQKRNTQRTRNRRKSYKNKAPKGRKTIKKHRGRKNTRKNLAK
jgi:hypothetical protein